VHVHVHVGYKRIFFLSVGFIGGMLSMCRTSQLQVKRNNESKLVFFLNKFTGVACHRDKDTD
jgi:hypothetical protein